YHAGGARADPNPRRPARASHPHGLTSIIRALGVLQVLPVVRIPPVPEVSQRSPPTTQVAACPRRTRPSCWSSRATCCWAGGSPRPVNRLPAVLSQAEAEELTAAPAGSDPVALRDRAVLELLYGSGLRVAELCALNEEDLEVDAQRVRVLGKGGKERQVPVGD